MQNRIMGPMEKEKVVNRQIARDAQLLKLASTDLK